MRQSILILANLWCFCPSWAQDSVEQRMSYTVEDAIVAIENEYRVRFSYSKQIVPYQEVVELDINQQSLPVILQALTDQTGIVYQQRGKRVALSYDPSLRGSMEEVTVEENGVEDQDLESLQDKEDFVQEAQVTLSANLADYEGELVVEEGLYFEQSKSLIGSRPAYDPVATLDALKEKDPRVLSIYPNEGTDIESKLTKTEDRAVPDEEEHTHLAQFSLVPLGSISQKKLDRKYHLSMNVISGRTGAVEGVEFGTFHNHITKELDGVQVSGLGNRVDGNVTGGQIAGWYNRTKGIVRGVQVAGLANAAKQADAFQVAGLYNYNHDVSRGFQAAGLFNISRNIAGSQFAGLFNSSSGSNNLQVAGIANMAGQTHVQVSGFVNVAREVKWLQVGIINVADTVGGASIGLLNLIKRGYNKVEFSTSEALYGNLAVKLGTKGFYNIFQVSTNFQKNQTGNGLVWGYGYGFGFFIPMNQHLKLNPEVLVMNVHERNFLQPDLNLLNQGKILFSFNRKKSLEYFAGPTFNLSISKVRHFDVATTGTNIAPYSLWQATYFRSTDSINTKFWIGFSAGIRI